MVSVMRRFVTHSRSIFYEMLTGRPPFAHVRTMDELKRTAADSRPVLSMPTNVTKYCLEILVCF
jgi:hypothetical protein